MVSHQATDVYGGGHCGTRTSSYLVLTSTNEELKDAAGYEPDRVLISCEALGLHHVQATQASSSHIVMDLAAIRRVPSRILSTSESDFSVFLCWRQ